MGGGLSEVEKQQQELCGESAPRSKADEINPGNGDMVTWLRGAVTVRKN